MKFNNKELTEIYFGPADLEGRLQHRRAHKSGSKERWFKLRNNFLFYHNINETGQIDKVHPSGVLILENYNVNVDVARDSCFAFSIVFRNDPQKSHIFSGQSESHIEHWIDAMKQASYGYWRSRLVLLQKILYEKTGVDPLLMYPRNRGTVRDEVWKYKPSFKSHIKSLAMPGSTSSFDYAKSTENSVDLT